MIRSPHGTRAMRGALTLSPPVRVLRAGPRRPGGRGEEGAPLPPLLQGYDEGILRACRRCTRLLPGVSISRNACSGRYLATSSGREAQYLPEQAFLVAK